MGYEQIYRDTVKGGDIGLSGFTSGALRLSIYGKTGVGKDAKLKKTYECGSLKDGTGAMSCVVKLRDGKLLAVINSYIAFDKDSVKKARTTVGNYPKDEDIVGDPMVRQDALNYANICYNGIIKQLVLNLKVKPDYVILMGDLNYRINQLSITAEMLADVFYRTGTGGTPGAAKEYYKYDELREQMEKQNIYQYDEGVDNNGPSFAPVCVMKKGRDCQTNYVGCWDISVNYILPSWCNRILYKSYDRSKMCCLKYDRFDHGKTIKKAKNSAVYALFQIGNCPPSLPAR